MEDSCGSQANFKSVLRAPEDPPNQHPTLCGNRHCKVQAARLGGSRHMVASLNRRSNDLNMNLRTHKLHTVIPVPPASAREAESFDRTWVSVVEEIGFRL